MTDHRNPPPTLTPGHFAPTIGVKSVRAAPETATLWLLRKKPAETPAPKVAPSLAASPEFELIRLIAKGGMGEVWAARQRSLDRVVAVKKLRDERLVNLSEEERRDLEASFRIEAFAAAALEHPNIVPVHDLGRSPDGESLLAMKLVKGKSWQSLIEEDWEPLREEEFLARHLPILISMAQAVAFAHSRGIVHRDLKPSQMMIGEFGESLLMDWGLAARFVARPELDDLVDGGGRHEHAIPEALPTVEEASNPAGTVVLMAPEQTFDSGAQIGPWTDVYLLGGTLYYLLTGFFPHSAETVTASFEKARNGAVIPASERNHDRFVPRELERIANAALAPSPNDRLEGAREFIEALQAYLSGAASRTESLAMVDDARRQFEALANEAATLEPIQIYLRDEMIAETLSRAMRLWPANGEAKAMASKSLAGRIRHEIECADYVSAEVHLYSLERNEPGYPEIADLRRRLSRGKQSAQRVRIQRTALAACVLLVLIIAAGFSFRAGQNERRAAMASLIIRNQAFESAAQRDLTQERLEGAGALIDTLLGGIRDSLDLTHPSDQRVAEAIAEAVEDYYGEGADERLTGTLRLEQARQLVRVTERFLELGRVNEAATLSAKAMVLSTKLPEDQSGVFDDAQGIHGQALSDLGKYEDAKRELSAAYERLAGKGEAEEAGAAMVAVRLAEVEDQLGNFDRAVGLLRHSLPILERAHGETGRPTLKALSMLAMTLSRSAPLAESRAAYEQLLERLQREDITEATADRELAGHLAALAEALERTGRTEEAIRVLRRLVQMSESIHGPGSAKASRSRFNLAIALYMGDEREDALTEVTSYIETTRALFGPDFPDLASAYLLRASILGESKGDTAAIPDAESALELMERTVGPDHPRNMVALNILASAYAGQGDFEKAIETATRNLELRKLHVSPTNQAFSNGYMTLGQIYARAGRFEEAREPMRLAIENLREVRGRLDGQTFSGEIQYSQVLTDSGDPTASVTYLDEVLAMPLPEDADPEMRKVRDRELRLARCFARWALARKQVPEEAAALDAANLDELRSVIEEFLPGRSPSAQALLARLLADTGNREAALAELDLLLREGLRESAVVITAEYLGVELPPVAPELTTADH